MPNKKKQTHKKVTRQFMLDLANAIYDTRSRRFMRLCSGTLQNGPDPTDQQRVMHCGLGELYFAMTGRQPNRDGVNEDKVVDAAVELSTFSAAAAAKKRQAIATVKALGLSDKLQGDLLTTLVDESDDIDFSPNEEGFRDILREIPTVNDDCYGNACTHEMFRKRSMRVARELRKAARLLPE